jgi:predicted aspartyl protease
MITTIPFKILSLDEEGFHLMVKMNINRKSANLIIDTGASKTVLDKTKAEKYVLNKNFALHNKLSSGLGTNTMESQTTILKKIKIGDIEIENYTTVLLDLSHVNNSYEQLGLSAVDGVLGSDILLKYNAIIDYEKKVLRLKYKKSKK